MCKLLYSPEMSLKLIKEVFHPYTGDGGVIFWRAANSINWSFPDFASAQNAMSEISWIINDHELYGLILELKSGVMNHIVTVKQIKKP